MASINRYIREELQLRTGLTEELMRVVADRALRYPPPEAFAPIRPRPGMPPITRLPEVNVPPGYTFEPYLDPANDEAIQVSIHGQEIIDMGAFAFNIRIRAMWVGVNTDVRYSVSYAEAAQLGADDLGELKYFLARSAGSRYGPIVRGLRQSGLMNPDVIMQAINAVSPELNRFIQRDIGEWMNSRRRPIPPPSTFETAGWHALAARPRPASISHEADFRAKQLLSSLLSQEQLRDFEATDSFVVKVSFKEWQYRPFRISRSLNHNVLDLVNGGTYCLHLPDVPIYDQMLGQKLLLETDPARFFAEANGNQRYGGVADGCMGMVARGPQQIRLDDTLNINLPR